MATQDSPEIALIRKEAQDAISEMFKRAIEHGANAPVIEDKKNELEDPLKKFGPLQNCEFGMILLLARDWMGKELSESIAPADLESSVKALVQQAIGRLLSIQRTDEGGRGESRSFFTGDPYSKRKNNPKLFAANLDAAMIYVAFLMLAVDQYNSELAKLELDSGIANLPAGIKNFRDAALFVIGDGLRYALACRVLKNNQFKGFTCDPDSQKERPEDGCLSREDRLFYTWTACETINDLREWRKVFLAKDAPPSPPLPEQTRLEIESLIDELEGTLAQASSWCKSEFFEEFSVLEVKDPKALVREVEKVGDGTLSGKQENDIAELKTCVQHVYHIAQYAAIRSLQPQDIEIPEVRVILDKMDKLVSRTIIGSGLDETEQDVLFKTLTREYSLGKWDGAYNDDAWYPLVVRSLAGLLARSRSDLGRRVSDSDLPALTDLVASFTRSLEDHVSNLLKRRPKGGENGTDGKLWSFVADQPYVLYATQRTIFALNKYEEFLNEVAKPIVRPSSASPGPERDPASIVAWRLAEHFRPMIAELLGQLGLSSGGSVPVPLPEEPWAAETVRIWVAALAADFKRCEIAGYLSKKAQKLIYIRKWADNYQPTQKLVEEREKPGIASRKEKGAKDQHIILKRDYDSICRMPGLSPEKDWTEESLVPVLFNYLFQEFVSQPVASIELLKGEESTELWKLVQSATAQLDNIQKLDPTANPQ